MRSSRTVVYIQYANPAAYPPLLHSAEILANAGWRVLVLGVTIPMVEDFEFARHPLIEVKLMPRVARGWRQKVHYARFCAWVAWHVVRRRAAWVYASDPLSSAAALVIRSLAGVRVLYHEHDIPDHPQPSAFIRIILAARKRLLRSADLVVVPSMARGVPLSTEAAGRLRCVWNCPRCTEIAPSPRPSAHEHDAFWVVYHGSIVPARLPPSVIRALALLPARIKLRIMGYETIGHVGYVQELLAIGASLGVADRIEVRLALPTRAALLECVDQCDVGLSLMPRRSDDLNERTMAGASNKAFDYLARGVPFIASDLPDWREMFIDPGFARGCDPDDPASIVDAIRWFYDHPDKTTAIGERGRRQITAEWNYERQFDPVLKIMQRMTA